MSPRSKQEYLEAIYLRYKKASLKEKTSILNEFCLNCGYHRKHAIRILNNFKRFTKPKLKKRGKPSKYNKPSILAPLKRIYLASNLPCSKRLKAIIPLWLPFYLLQFGSLSEDSINALKRISAPTIDRLLKPVRVKYQGRGRCTTKPGTLLKKQFLLRPTNGMKHGPASLKLIQ